MPPSASLYFSALSSASSSTLPLLTYSLISRRSFLMTRWNVLNKGYDGERRKYMDGSGASRTLGLACSGISEYQDVSIFLPPVRFNKHDSCFFILRDLYFASWGTYERVDRLDQERIPPLPRLLRSMFLRTTSLGFGLGLNVSEHLPRYTWRDYPTVRTLFSRHTRGGQSVVLASEQL